MEEQPLGPWPCIHRVHMGETKSCISDHQEGHGLTWRNSSPLTHKPHQYPLEEVMGRQQHKHTFNNMKSYMEQSETSGSTPARTEHPSADKAKQKEIKYNLMKMIETLKEK